MDIGPIIEALGGGLPAVALVGLGFLYWRERQISDKLVNKLIDISREQVTALSELTRRIDGGK